MTEPMRQYYVRVALSMNAHEPGEAVTGLVDLFTDQGFRNWIYRVDDFETQELIGYFNGWGEEVDIAAVMKDVDVQEEHAPEQSAPVDDWRQKADEDLTSEDVDEMRKLAQPVSNDDELLQLAESLNEES